MRKIVREGNEERERVISLPGEETEEDDAVNALNRKRKSRKKNSIPMYPSMGTFLREK
jgi:hypothetical protein